MAESPAPKDSPSGKDHASDTTPFRFLDLPLELRNAVYAHLLVQEAPIVCSRVWFTTAARHLRRLAKEKAVDCCGRNFGCAHWDARLRPRTGILRASRQVGDEALDVLYGRNTFDVALESRSVFLRFFTAVGEDNLRRVRRLKLGASTHYYSYYIAGPGEKQWQFFRPAVADRGAWTALLEGLVELEFVMLVPIWGHHRCWPVWVEQLETVLSFVGEHVDAGTDVTVDDNYSMFLCEAVDRCFPKPFRRVKTQQGDSYYYKTRFDPENITGPVASDEG
ncbi:hypothetical protein F4818DRAFT_411911 [Hypoxylon cercidicola]|nr:hypothetical protein F4818DRAFT_411911 [Hypoxylon cercidicola]